MYCNNCGYNNPQESVFCAKCGEMLNNQTQSEKVTGAPKNAGVKAGVAPNKPKNKNIGCVIAVIIAAVIAAITIATIAIVIIVLVVKENNSSNNYSSYSSYYSYDSTHMREILMQDWDTEGNGEMCFSDGLSLDFGYDKVKWEPYYRRSDIFGYEKVVTFDHTYEYKIVSDTEIELYYSSNSTSPKHYYISFNGDYTVMYLKEKDNGVGEAKSYVLYAKNPI